MLCWLCLVLFVCLCLLLLSLFVFCLFGFHENQSEQTRSRAPTPYFAPRFSRPRKRKKIGSPVNGATSRIFASKKRR